MNDKKKQNKTQKAKHQRLNTPKGNKNRPLDPKGLLNVDIDLSYDPDLSPEENTRSAFYRILYECQYRDISSTDISLAFSLIRWDLIDSSNMLPGIDAHSDSRNILKARLEGNWDEVSRIVRKWKEKFEYVSFTDLVKECVP